MLFDSGEFLVFTEHGVTTKNKSEMGVLILTNKRMVLETTRNVKSGLFSKQKKDIILYNVPLTNILIADKKKDFVFKKHEFSINADGQILVFRVNEPHVWITQIAAAKSGNLSNTGINSSNNTTNLIIKPPMPDENQTKPEISTTQNEIIKIRCTQCKSLVDENVKFCPNCGAKMFEN